MSDADDYTRCAGCDCSLCLITGAYFDMCLDCEADLCWDCQIKYNIRKKSASTGNRRDMSLPEDFTKTHKYINEDDDDFEDYGETGFLGGCPFCDAISDKDILNYLIEISGKTRIEIEQEIKGKK